MNRRPYLHLLTILCALLTTWLSAIPAQAQDEPEDKPDDGVTTIGIVVDGPSAFFDDVRTRLLKEAEGLLSDRKIEVPADKTLRGDWTMAKSRRHLDRLLNDPSVEVVIAMGPLSSSLALDKTALRKPVLAPFVPGAIVTKKRAGKRFGPRLRNLSYIHWALDLKRDLKMLSSFGTFKRVAFFVGDALTKALPVVSEEAKALAKEQGVELVVVPAGKDLVANLKGAGNVDAVYVGPLLDVTPEDLRKFADALITRKLPSMSFFGRLGVDQGLLAGLSGPHDTERLVRRAALNLQQIALGDDPSTLVTAYRTSERLSLNLTTASAIDLTLSWSLLAEADVVGAKRKVIKRKLSLAKVVEEAEKVNLDLRSARKATDAGQENIYVARARLLPRIDASLTGSWIDSDRAGLGGAERQLQWSAGLSQVIFSEPVWAGLTIQEHLQSSRVADLRTARLDVTLEASVAYLNVLAAKTAESIQRENVRLTRENLALARTRRRAGIGRPSEVLRWESAIATQRSSLINAIADRNAAEIALNRVLNRPTEEPFETQEASIDDAFLLSSEPMFRTMFTSPTRFRKMRTFLVEHGIKASPELDSLAAVSRAKKREAVSARREPWIPTLAAEARVTHRFLLGGAGSDNSALSAALPGFPIANNLDWQVGVTASIPLFEGGERYARARRAEKESEQIEINRSSVKLAVDQAVRTNLHRAGASFAGIALTRDAAQAADKNLELVATQYQQGASTIVELLDAQNQALTASLASTRAAYAFLADLMRVERSIGRFDFSRSPEQTRAFLNRMNRYVETR